MCQNASRKVLERADSQAALVWREDDKERHMIYKILGGVALALVVLVLVGLEVRATGSYSARSMPPKTRYGECGTMRIR